MKIRSGYFLRKVMDVHVVMGVGSEAYAPDRIMSVNETGAFLWGLLEKGADRDGLVDALAGEYGIDRDTAARDTDVFLGLLRERDLLEG